MKKFAIILVLLFLNLISYKYLKVIINSKVPFEPIEDTALIIQKDDIKITDKEEFDFNNYFLVESFSKYSSNYQLDDNKLNVFLSSNNINNTFTYDYELIEPEVITNIIYQEVEPTYSNYEVEEDYFDLYEESLQFSKGTSLNEIINEVSNCFDTNQEVTIDYSSLNPYIEGDYSVYLISDSQTFEIFIQIV